MSSQQGETVASPPSGRGAASGVLSVLAVLLAVAALAISILIPGPQGTPGTSGTNGSPGPDGVNGTNGTNGTSCWDLNGNGVPDLATEDTNGDGVVNVLDCRGPQGLPGAGTEMSYATLITLPVTGTCANLLTVSMNPSTTGTIVVTLTFELTTEHTAGTPDEFDLYGGGCAGVLTRETVPVDLPTASYRTPIAIQMVVSVVIPGAISISTGAQMSAGASAGDQINTATMTAVFYPS